MEKHYQIKRAAGLMRYYQKWMTFKDSFEKACFVCHIQPTNSSQHNHVLAVYESKGGFIPQQYI
jgi:hypothetical protein